MGIQAEVSFQSGDVVRLKSGGAKMTISHQASADSYFCVWFNKNDDLQSTTVKVNVLEACKEPERAQAAPLKTQHSW
ncbi:DUF2158 domain-containing protein [Acinetobacter pittii]|uniref:DUF2158 domain-containing protein n=1 Tax=Acinetobacter oleivorans TaxID=1148157 RepID=A0ABR9NHC1_9GAMM|nr:MULTISPECIES: DUF2158 domain-containing protein [Acinetobacter]MBE2163706.1 DUF2158 domain-containing protein [Acinetobacter oleivorans]MDO7243400.1 DUF2158 domain-containing protein [Acinetobacter pittii]